MATIKKILMVPIQGASFTEDILALQEHPIAPADRYLARATAPDQEFIREPSEGVSIGLEMDDGSISWGDCIGVSFGGTHPQGTVFRSGSGIESIKKSIIPVLQGRSLDSFREITTEIDNLTETIQIERPIDRPSDASEEPILKMGMTRRQLFSAPARLLRSVQQEIDAEKDPATELVNKEQPLAPAVRYGVSQALLGAIANVRGLTMAEILAKEWNLAIPHEMVSIHAQCGTDRMDGADRTIVRRADSLPHGFVDDIGSLVGTNGDELTRYVRWLVKRIDLLGDATYAPTIHLDVQGALGKIYDHQIGKILGQLYALELAAKPFQLYIESPVIMSSRDEQIKTMSKLREYVGFRKMKTKLVADEWVNNLKDVQAFIDGEAADMIHLKLPAMGSIHNTMDAILACQSANIGTLLGGSSAETFSAARISVGVALAARPDAILSKPGMDVDVSISHTRNEMARVLCTINNRIDSGSPSD